MEDYQKIAAIKQALHIDEHYLVVLQDSWFVRHPLACREAPEGCWATREVAKMDKTRLSRYQGTFRMSQDVSGPEESDVQLVLTRVDPGTDRMMDRLKELGVW